jgi:hypothetical protein
MAVLGAEVEPLNIPPKGGNENGIRKKAKARANETEVTDRTDKSSRKNVIYPCNPSHPFHPREVLFLILCLL